MFEIEVTPLWYKVNNEEIFSQFHAGISSYKSGVSRDENPHSVKDRGLREAWFNGWDAGSTIGSPVTESKYSPLARPVKQVFRQKRRH